MVAEWTSRLRGQSSNSKAQLQKENGSAANSTTREERPGFYELPPQAEAELSLHAIAERDCKLCFVFTPTVRFSRASQFRDMFPSLAHHAQVQINFIPYANHLFTLLASQEALTCMIEDWMSNFLRESSPANEQKVGMTSSTTRPPAPA